MFGYTLIPSSLWYSGIKLIMVLAGNRLIPNIAVKIAKCEKL